MSDLSEFLLARVAEDEAVARAAAKKVRSSFGEPTTLHWWSVHRNHEGISVYDFPPEEVGEKDVTPTTKHITRHDPAHVIAECDAKRRIVAWVKQWPWRAEPPSSVDGLLELLALPYADHPDYDESWRP